MQPAVPPSRRLRRVILRALLPACVLAWSPAAGAQDVGLEALPGSEAERYLRALQVSGTAPLHPWGIRGFSPAELDRLLEGAGGDHPWADRSHPGREGVRLVRPRVELSYASGFPDGRNDGPVWSGKGLTVLGSGGAAARWGALSLRVEPVAFWAQNAGFDLAANGQTGELAYRDPVTPFNIDLPQRFGDEAYARLDPGSSTARVDAAGFAAGISTANQQWGPAVDQPLVLGANAPGFLHGFLGTASPWKVGIGRLHGRMVWGSLDESAYSPSLAGRHDRFMAGLTAVFLPWGLDGLEVGFTRFFHMPSDSGVDARDFLRPVESLFKAGLDDGGETSVENQIASVHARWVLPRAGLEVYGELARDDHSYDLLDFFLHPDHSSMYLLGGSRAWRRGRSLLWLRAEWVSSQASHLATVRNQGNRYRHVGVRQGHTHRGQLLGSPAGYGGGGSVVALESFTPRGRWSVDWTRTRVRDNWGGQAVRQDNPDAMTDVVHSLGAEGVAFRGPVDAVARLRGSWELNRAFGGDAFSLTGSLGLRIGL